ncbi:MAG TPA: hypothetical protein VFS37_08790 [Conexibacter sp.]|nr:hypothetical protein [Conexibacter sp.]
MGVGAPRRARAGARTGRALRIAAMYIDGTAAAYYRAMLPLRELERRGHRVLWPAQNDYERLLADASGVDVFLMHHYCREQDLALVQHLARRGVAVVWDEDDDISATPRHAPVYRKNGGRKGMKRAFARSVEIARTASLMTTPSAHLADRYRELGVEHVEVIENHVAQEHIGPERPRHQGVVIGITAAGEHAVDFKKLRIDRTLKRLLEAHEGVRVVTIGWGHELPTGRHQHVPYVQIEDLIAAERQFDVALAPLADTPFSRARSNVKLKEYAAAGAMWLASPVGPYVGMGEPQGGMLVRDGEWYAALERFVLDFRGRTHLMERARAWAQTQSAAAAARQWEAALMRAVARVRAS